MILLRLRLNLLIIILFAKNSIVMGHNDQVPKSDKFNLGISTGLGGVHWFFKPSLEFRFKRVHFSATPGFLFYGFNAEFDMIKLRKKEGFKNQFFIISGQYQHQFSAMCIDICQERSYKDFYTVLLGYKKYSRLNDLSLSLKFGGLFYTETIYPGNKQGRSEQYPKYNQQFVPFGEVKLACYFLK